MQFFLYEIVTRIVAIYLCVDCSRKLWCGLVERKIAYFNPDLLRKPFTRRGNGSDVDLHHLRAGGAPLMRANELCAAAFPWLSVPLSPIPAP